MSRLLRRAPALGARHDPYRSLAARCFSDWYTPDTRCESERLYLDFAATCMPHPNKMAKGGEDAYFACPVSRSFGVADGVGGWAEAGVDPGKFARSLLRFAYTGLRRAPVQEEAQLGQALHDAWLRLHEEEIQGGSTALLGQLNDSTLSILNLGDSGAIILRPALRTPPGSDQPLLFPRVVFRSSDQTHYFNCPYQLGSSNSPIEAPDLVRVAVREGDLVLAATDGIFDNLFDHQVQAIVARDLGSVWRGNQAVGPHLQGLADSIARQAQKIGQQEDQKEIITPFALSAHSEGLAFRGGKLDDTTIVVGLVCKEDLGEKLQDGSVPNVHNFDGGA